MEYTVNQLYQYLFEKPLAIYEIFKGFFGKDFVDIQTCQGRELSSFKEYLLAKICDESFMPKEAAEEEYNLSFNITEMQLKELKTTLEDKRLIIYVWWPRVTVTNEYNKSVNIQDLYAKIEIISSCALVKNNDFSYSSSDTDCLVDSSPNIAEAL